MTASILSFRAQAGQEIPTPRHWQPGDVYDVLELHDDSLIRAGFVNGAAFYVKVGHVLPGVPHLSMWRGRPRLGYVIQAGTHSLSWHSFDPLMPSREYSFQEVEIVGCVTEIWSFGIGEGKPRWCFDEVSAMEAAQSLPPLLKQTV